MIVGRRDVIVERRVFECGAVDARPCQSKLRRHFAVDSVLMAMRAIRVSQVCVERGLSMLA